MKHLWPTLLLLGWTSTAAAVPPEALLPIQGYLTDSDGVALDGDVDILFELLDDTGAVIHTEAYMGTEQVTVTEGYFTVYLGDTVALDMAAIAASGAIFLRITVGSDSPMDLMQLALTPYAVNAFQCESALALGGTPAGDFALAEDAISAVVAGAGLTGGGDSSEVSLALADGGVTTAAIADGTITSADIDWSSWVAACGGNEYLYGVSAAGAPLCRTDQTGTSNTGDITAVNAGNGLTGGGDSGGVTLAIASGGVGESELASNAVTAQKIAAGAVGSSEIADGSIAAADVNTSQIQRVLSSSCDPGEFMTGISGTSPSCAAAGGGGLGDNTVTSSHIVDGTIEAGDLATTAKPAMAMAALGASGDKNTDNPTALHRIDVTTPGSGQITLLANVLVRAQCSTPGANCQDFRIGICTVASTSSAAACGGGLEQVWKERETSNLVLPEEEARWMTIARTFSVSGTGPHRYYVNAVNRNASAAQTIAVIQGNVVTLYAPTSSGLSVSTLVQ